MRSLATLCLLCAALAGCKEQAFDERYSEQEQKLSSEAAAMDAELDQRMTEKPGMETPAEGEAE
ncbi:hypothetical protein SZ64_01595 [Erythrobacter sp. SG61-1L]|uniref:hypothetical protein n=1 Tax=Erythrobacter sp. SG61-1L TaxID=1603897 RepID=UPI0006C9343B|nr:hypothetical protein [Erythrobacter sp. SG61-1L]KPL66903.1 hypothetical protein SZ64_01595 [Erythrobacter sp. SG61-1L]